MDFEINGNKFRSKKGFYRHVEQVFTNTLGWRIGRSLDALEDILYGGFGRHDPGEEIRVIWSNFQKSRQCLNGNFLLEILEILQEAENVTFEKYDYRK